MGQNHNTPAQKQKTGEDVHGTNLVEHEQFAQRFTRRVLQLLVCVEYIHVEALDQLLL